MEKGYQEAERMILAYIFRGGLCPSPPLIRAGILSDDAGISWSISA